MSSRTCLLLLARSGGKCRRVNTCGMRASSGLDGLYAFGWESIVPDEEFLVLPVAGLAIGPGGERRAEHQ